jgi:hypothetical protein
LTSCIEVLDSDLLDFFALTSIIIFVLIVFNI